MKAKFTKEISEHVYHDSRIDKFGSLQIPIHYVNNQSMIYVESFISTHMIDNKHFEQLQKEFNFAENVDRLVD